MLYPAFLVAGRATAEDLRDVEEELASYLPREQEARALEERINTLRRQKAEMEAVVRERRKWSELLEELGAALPAQVWMTELEVASSGEILFTGRATSLAAVGKFLAAVQSLPFWQEVELRSVQAVPEDKTLLEFTIRAAFAES
ncbi:MAG: PilN domain-containing protein [Thermoanaerobacteraceae bacterium]|nr:PilN domain-containing protein [Thermoanaerobacteraceae bacterium]